MNRYESIILDKMVEIRNGGSEAGIADAVGDILLLLDCICEFREPPREIQVEEGYGAMAVVE